MITVIIFYKFICSYLLWLYLFDKQSSVIHTILHFELVVQNLRICTGHCNNPLLHRNVWCKGHGGAQIEEIKHEKKDEVFIDSIIDKSNVYNNCLKSLPSTVIHAWQRQWRLAYTSKDAMHSTHTCSNSVFLSKEIVLKQYRHAIPIHRAHKVASR